MKIQSDTREAMEKDFEARESKMFQELLVRD